MPKKKTQEEFCNEIKTLTNGEYEVIGEYVNNQTLVEIKHNKCGKITSFKPNAFITPKRGKTIGQRCRCEYKNHNSMSYEEFMQRCNNTHGDEISEYIIHIKKEDWKSASEYIYITHIKCNNKYRIKAIDFANGNRCNKCSYQYKIHNRKNTEMVSKEIYELTKGEYSLVSEYKNNKEPVLIKHNKCGNIFKISYNKFKSSNRRCHKCGNKSNGEQIISSYLTNKNFKFDYDKSIEGCTYKGSLRFDFIIYIEDIKVIIEYDGRQHFMPVNFDGDMNTAIEAFNETKIRDEIKNEFCDKKNIPIFRIPYTVTNINKELDEIFIKVQRLLSTLNNDGN